MMVASEERGPMMAQMSFILPRTLLRRLVSIIFCLPLFLDAFQVSLYYIFSEILFRLLFFGVFFSIRSFTGVHINPWLVCSLLSKSLQRAPNAKRFDWCSESSRWIDVYATFLPLTILSLFFGLDFWLRVHISNPVQLVQFFYHY